MLPWGHAAFGYLLYHLYTARTGRRPAGSAVLALAVGTQFPDLVDKPHAWTLGVLPSGRSLGHSLLTLAVLCGVLFVLFSPSKRRAVVAFTIGYASHIVGDGVAPLVAGDFTQLLYVLWPVTAAPLSDDGMTFLAFFTSLEGSAWVLFGIGLTVVGVVVWARDGYPGVRDLLRPVLTGRTEDSELDT